MAQVLVAANQAQIIALIVQAIYLQPVDNIAGASLRHGPHQTVRSLVYLTTGLVRVMRQMRVIVHICAQPCVQRSLGALVEQLV